jgi:hypothetical protein
MMFMMIAIGAMFMLFIIVMMSIIARKKQEAKR